MTHGQICNIFIKWFMQNYPGWFILQNNSGYASAEHVRYGMPSTGGGFDFFAFGPGAQTEFFEIKTIAKPTLQKNQKAFDKKMSAKGFKCWVVKEHDCDQGFYIVEAVKYRPTKSWPY